MPPQGQFLPRHCPQSRYRHRVPLRYPVTRYNTRLQEKTHRGTTKAPFNAECAVTLRVHPFFRISADPSAALVQLPLDYRITVGALLYEQQWRAALQTLSALLQAIRQKHGYSDAVANVVDIYRGSTLASCGKPLQGQQERLALLQEGSVIVAVSAEDLALSRGERSVEALIDAMPATPDHRMFARPAVCVPGFFCIRPCSGPECERYRQQQGQHKPGFICLCGCSHPECAEIAANMALETCEPGAVCATACGNVKCSVLRRHLSMPEPGGGGGGGGHRDGFLCVGLCTTCAKLIAKLSAETCTPGEVCEALCGNHQCLLLRRHAQAAAAPPGCFCLSENCNHRECKELRGEYPPSVFAVTKSENYTEELARFAATHPHMCPIYQECMCGPDCAVHGAEGSDGNSSGSRSDDDDDEAAAAAEERMPTKPTRPAVAEISVDTETISSSASRLVDALASADASAQWAAVTRLAADVCFAAPHTEVVVVEVTRCPLCPSSGGEEVLRISRVDLPQYALWRAAKVQAGNTVEKYGTAAATTYAGGLRLQAAHVCSMYRKVQATAEEIAGAGGRLAVYATDRLITKPVVLLIRGSGVHEHVDDV